MCGPPEPWTNCHDLSRIMLAVLGICPKMNRVKTMSFANFYTPREVSLQYLDMCLQIILPKMPFVLPKRPKLTNLGIDAQQTLIAEEEGEEAEETNVIGVFKVFCLQRYISTLTHIQTCRHTHLYTHTHTHIMKVLWLFC